VADAALPGRAYIGSMLRSRSCSPASWLLAGVVLCAPGQAAAQGLGADYTLTSPSLPVAPELGPEVPVAAWGPVRLGSSGPASGNGLSLEAGQKWFARAGLGRSLDTDAVAVGGGYRFLGGDALSMHVTRQFGQERLGLAVRYDWHRSYLRLSYEQPLRTPGASERLRFSAGMRF
jgi:hypothetical protein